jgi:hypothetical protein
MMDIAIHMGLGHKDWADVDAEDLGDGLGRQDAARFSMGNRLKPLKNPLKQWACGGSVDA